MPTKPAKQDEKPYRILGFEVDNILRVVAVNIRPDGRVLELTGKNANGKSSIINALWMAFGGEGAIPSRPIHDGADAGHVIVDVGNDDGLALRVTRKLKAKPDGKVTTSLVVENADGTRFSNPSVILKSLVGALSCDPLDFMRMKPKEQYDLLKRFVVGIDFDALDEANKADFAKRTEVNRRADQFRKQAAGITVPSNAPVERIDDSAILARLTSAAEHNTEIERLKSQNERNLAAIDDLRARAAGAMKEAELLRQKAAAWEADAAILEEKLSKAPAIPKPVNVEDLSRELEQARARNEIVALAERRNDLIAEAEIAEAESAELTAAMAERTEQKRKAVASAKMPVPNLSFGDDQILLNGFPITEASGAEQLRLSVGIAAALQPRLRFVTIKDASLLDDDSWAALQRIADEMDLLIIAETVTSDRPTAVWIEDGMVKTPALQAAE